MWLPADVRAALFDGSQLADDWAEALLLVGENEQLDLKGCSYLDKLGSKADDGRPKVARALAAFGNARGGVLAIGLSEEDGANPVSASGTIERWKQFQHLVAAYVEPSLQLEVQAFPVQGGELVLVSVPASRDSPHAVRKGSGQDVTYQFPVRRGTETEYLREWELAHYYGRRAAASAGLDHAFDAIQRRPRVKSLLPAELSSRRGDLPRDRVVQFELTAVPSVAGRRTLGTDFGEETIRLLDEVATRYLDACQLETGDAGPFEIVVQSGVGAALRKNDFEIDIDAQVNGSSRIHVGMLTNVHDMGRREGQLRYVRCRHVYAGLIAAQWLARAHARRCGSAGDLDAVMRFFGDARLGTEMGRYTPRPLNERTPHNLTFAANGEGLRPLVGALRPALQDLVSASGWLSPPGLSPDGTLSPAEFIDASMRSDYEQWCSSIGVLSDDTV